MFGLTINLSVRSVGMLYLAMVLQIAAQIRECPYNKT